MWGKNSGLIKMLRQPTPRNLKSLPRTESTRKSKKKKVHKSPSLSPITPPIRSLVILNPRHDTLCLDEETESILGALRLLPLEDRETLKKENICVSQHIFSDLLFSEKHVYKIISPNTACFEYLNTLLFGHCNVQTPETRLIQSREQVVSITEKTTAVYNATTGVLLRQKELFEGIPLTDINILIMPRIKDIVLNDILQNPEYLAQFCFAMGEKIGQIVAIDLFTYNLDRFRLPETHTATREEFEAFLETNEDFFDLDLHALQGIIKKLSCPILRYILENKETLHERFSEIPDEEDFTETLTDSLKIKILHTRNLMFTTLSDEKTLHNQPIAIDNYTAPSYVVESMNKFQAYKQLRQDISAIAQRLTDNIEEYMRLDTHNPTYVTTS